jgi:hypothetical protein
VNGLWSKYGALVKSTAYLHYVMLYSGRHNYSNFIIAAYEQLDGVIQKPEWKAANTQLSRSYLTFGILRLKADTGG